MFEGTHLHVVPSTPQTADTIIFPDLVVYQRARGYRFGLDSLLLTAFLADPPPSPLIDLGCGTGIIPLLAARKWPSIDIVGLELQDELASLAGLGIHRNSLSARISLLRGDLRSCADFFRPASFSTVVSNPPYRRSGSGRIPPDPVKARACHELSMTIDDLLAAAAHLLRPAGQLYLSWKPERAAELRGALSANGMRLTRLRPVSSHPGQPPFLHLCRCAKEAGEAAPTSEPPLVVRGPGGYSPEMQHLFATGFFPSPPSPVLS